MSGWCLCVDPANLQSLFFVLFVCFSSLWSLNEVRCGRKVVFIFFTYETCPFVIEAYCYSSIPGFIFPLCKLPSHTCDDSSWGECYSTFWVLHVSYPIKYKNVFLSLFLFCLLLAIVLASFPKGVTSLKSYLSTFKFF